MLDAHFYQSFEDGEIIFPEGSMGNCAFLIERGTVEIIIQHEGKSMVLATRSTGEIFGEMAMVDDLPRSASARAVGEVELLVLSHEQFKFRLDSIDPVLRLIMRTILERYRETLMRLKFETADLGIQMTKRPESGSLRGDWGRKDALDRIKLERDLKRGLRNQELTLHYQPIIDLASRTTIAFEALVRWNHPTRGTLPPAVFLSAAEDSELVALLGSYVASEACRALQQLSQIRGDVDGKPLMMHINVSPRHLMDPIFVQDIVDAADGAGVAHSSLMLEVTEGLLIDEPERAMARLSECVEQGFQVALDDFGTGYSSLSYLSQFPLAEIKIDRSFVSSMAHNQRSLKILSMLCNLAGTLGLNLVAEGIEDPEQAKTVHGLGCEYGQGYLFGRPFALAHACKHLRQQVEDQAAA